jgi:hypothetical protein
MEKWIFMKFMKNGCHGTVILLIEIRNWWDDLLTIKSIYIVVPAVFQPNTLDGFWAMLTGKKA